MVSGDSIPMLDPDLELLDHCTDTTSSNAVNDVNSKFLLFEKLNFGLTKLNHHLCNLQTYNKCGVVPKGLFIKRKPTIFGNSSPQFKEKWNKAHEELSSKLIALSIEECALQIEQTQADMATLKTDMADHLDLQSLENMEQATREKVKTLATKLSGRRAKKLRK